MRSLMCRINNTYEKEHKPFPMHFCIVHTLHIWGSAYAISHAFMHTIRKCMVSPSSREDALGNNRFRLGPLYQLLLALMPGFLGPLVLRSHPCPVLLCPTPNPIHSLLPNAQGSLNAVVPRHCHNESCCQALAVSCGLGLGQYPNHCILNRRPSVFATSLRANRP